MSPSSTPRVLLVDDDLDFTRAVMHWLRRAGYDVVAAADGDAAVRLAVARAPRVVLLDVMLAIGEWLLGARAPALASAAPQTPVIMVTADATHRTRASRSERSGS